MTSYRFRSRIDNAAYHLPEAPNQNLDHIPGPKVGWFNIPLFRFLRDNQGFVATLAKQYGDIFVVQGLFRRKAIFMIGADANRVVLGNADKTFSSHRAYSSLKVFVGDSIPTRDFEDHAELRKLIAPPFSGSAMPEYLQQINLDCDKHINNVICKENGNEVHFYSFAKALALDIATSIFGGIDLGPETKRMSDSLQAILNIGDARVPIPLPGTILAKAINGRTYADKYFRSLIPSRRESKSADLFTRLSVAENEVGERLSDQDIVDNVIGAMIAGHDTSTVAMTALAYEFAKSPSRQNQLAAKCQQIHEHTGYKNLSYSHLSQLKEIDMYIKEALRVYTPVRYIQRRLIQDFEYKGHVLPANSNVILAIHHTHQSPKYFEQPERFYPERFSDDSKYVKIPNYAWAPFGKGAHLCIGMQFAMLEIKALIYKLLLDYEILLPAPYNLEMTGFAFSKPKGSVPLLLKRRERTAYD